MTTVKHLPLAELEAGLDDILSSPKDAGEVKLIVRRPAVDTRELLQEVALDTEVGLVGDTWQDRPSSTSPDGLANPLAQLTIMNSRAAALISQADDRWQLAGDQLYVDLDIGRTNLAPGTRLGIGDAVIEVTDKPHTGCEKFSTRFGVDALKFVSTPEGRDLCLRGINTKVVRSGVVRVGDLATKL